MKHIKIFESFTEDRKDPDNFNSIYVNTATLPESGAISCEDIDEAYAVQLTLLKTGYKWGGSGYYINSIDKYSNRKIRTNWWIVWKKKVVPMEHSSPAILLASDISAFGSNYDEIDFMKYFQYKHEDRGKELKKKYGL